MNSLLKSLCAVRQTRYLILSVLIAAGVAGVLLVYQGLSLAVFAGVYQLRPEDPVQMAFAPNIEQPYILTRDGTLLQPGANSWSPMLDTPVNDMYIGFNGVIYAGTDTGLLRYENQVWQQVEGVPPTDDVEAMHGFLFAMGPQGVARTIQGRDENKSWQMLKLPYPDAPARGFVMLGDHSHVILNDRLAITHDMGLSWETLDAPGQVNLMAADADGNLLAVTTKGVYRWRFHEKTWAQLTPVPPEAPVEALCLFQGQIYALAGGQVWQLEGETWASIPVAGNRRYVTALAVRYPDRLWAADPASGLLWYTTDTQNWESAGLSR